MAVMISSCIIELIHREATDAAPNEACGLLFGADHRIARVSVTANIAADPRKRFEIDAAALFAALRVERAGGERIAGYWHSHPGGNAFPSVTDARSANPDGRLWLIVAGGEATLWRAGNKGVHGRFERVELSVEPG